MLLSYGMRPIQADTKLITTPRAPSSRRSFLKQTALALPVLSSLFSAEGCKQKPNTVLPEIPTSLQGAKKIEKKVWPSDAKIILIHFGQLHDIPSLKIVPTRIQEQATQLINANQKEIDLIVRELTRTLKIHSLYPEGLADRASADEMTKDAQTLAGMYQLLEKNQSTLRAIEATMKAKTLSPEASRYLQGLRDQAKEMEIIVETLNASRRAKNRESINHAFELAARHGFVLKTPCNEVTAKIPEQFFKPTQRIVELDLEIKQIAARAQAMQAGKEAIIEEEIEKMHTKLKAALKEKDDLMDSMTKTSMDQNSKLFGLREQILIENLVLDYTQTPNKSAPYISSTLYGVGHDFSKVVEDHNLKNPKRKIALLQITPNTDSGVIGLEHLLK